LKLKIKSQKTADFGLNIMHGISYSWFNGADPLDALEVNKVIF
jgi:Zn-dependent M16 (insulinase) family peptidase